MIVVIVLVAAIAVLVLVLVSIVNNVVRATSFLIVATIVPVVVIQLCMQGQILEVRFRQVPALSVWGVGFRVELHSVAKP